MNIWLHYINATVSLSVLRVV